MKYPVSMLTVTIMASLPAFAEELTPSQIEVADVDESTPEVVSVDTSEATLKT